ncbi:Clathrin adaptor complexes medium subunit family protein [Prunus dulcis]|uniref:Clathrin adaptor complexes medium subunit family protein n=1 Tax=Prunus dulcis TaxID=3755 RepID=A0A5H2XQL0_PRUDU|nr:Clathrin adaptor complexes medium subunit family protein [Prunus dulcis]
MNESCRHCTRFERRLTRADLRRAKRPFQGEPRSDLVVVDISNLIIETWGSRSIGSMLCRKSHIETERDGDIQIERERRTRSKFRFEIRVELCACPTFGECRAQLTYMPF